MNGLDIFFLVLLGAGLIRGLIKGFIHMAAALLALVLGTILALKLSGTAQEYIQGKVDVSASWLPIVSFAVVFLLVALAIFLLAFLLDKLAKAVALGLINRILGALFGLAMNAMIISVILVILNTIDEHKPFLPKEKIAQSKLYQPLSKLTPSLFPSLTTDKLKILQKKEPDPATTK
jgi:membrane protein required for colicin V production